MRLLLDTHIWLWSLIDPKKLAGGVAAALDDEGNGVWLSPVSVWEVLLLADKGKIDLQPDPERWVRDVLRAVPLEEAPLTREVAIQSRRIAVPNQDPADRFLAATAQVHDLTLVTNDRDLQRVEGISVLPNR